MIAAFGICDETGAGRHHRAVAMSIAVHLTLLKPDGSGKAEVEPNKLMVGSPARSKPTRLGGLPIVIAPPNDLLGLAITEGIEDALTAHAGDRAWRLGRWLRVVHAEARRDASPTTSSAITIFAHADRAGQDGAHTLAAKLRERGIETTIEGLGDE